jgi:hypothetical protein
MRWLKSSSVARNGSIILARRISGRKGSFGPVERAREEHVVGVQYCSDDRPLQSSHRVGQSENWNLAWIFFLMILVLVLASPRQIFAAPSN